MLLITAWVAWRIAISEWSLAFGITAWHVLVFSIGVGTVVWFSVRLFAQAAATPATQLLLLAASVTLLAFLADQVATHYVTWRAVAPLVAPATREKILGAWSRRFVDPAFMTSDSIRRSSLAPIGDYRLSYLFVLGTVCLTIVATVSWATSSLYGFFTVAVLFALVLALAVAWMAFGQEQPVRNVRLALRAITVWLTYDPQDSPAAGVFKSPNGSFLRRATLAGFSLVLVSAATVPFASYFPIPLLLGDRQPWIEAANEPFFWESRDTEPTPDFSLPTHIQKRYADRLDQRRREAYLEQLQKRNETAYRLDQATARANRLFDTPGAWAIAAFRGSLTGDSRFIAALVLGVFLSLFFPLVFSAAVFTLVTGRTLRLVDDEIAQHRWHDELIDNDWDAHVAHLQCSQFPATNYDTKVAERDHLFLGVNAHARYPVLLHRDILGEHAHILGDSGSGKTALGLAPMIAQLARLSGRLSKEPNTPPGEQVSIVIIDLKGDRALFHGAKHEAEKAGLPFKWFTNIREHATFAFNPFQNPHIRNLTTAQRTEVFLQALGLQYGEFYGGGYFSSINQTVLRRYLHTYHPDIFSFQDLASKLQSPALYQATFRDSGVHQARRNEWREAGHLFARVDSLAALTSINLTPALVEKQAVAPEVLNSQIDMGDVLERPQVIYFYLSSITEAVAVQGIAKLALYSLLTAAETREPGTSTQVYCFIDEFQQIVANNLELVLRQARSKNIGCILANQNITDLDTKDGNLMDTVEANTAFKQVFRASSHVQRKHLVETSGETIYHMLSTTTRGRETSRTVSEDIGPRFRINDVIEASFEPTQSLVMISKGSGYTQYGGQMFALDSGYHISQREYQRRTHAPWPTADTPGTFMASNLDPALIEGTSPQEPFVPPRTKEKPPVSKAKPEEPSTPPDASVLDAIEAFKKGTKP